MKKSIRIFAMTVMMGLVPVMTSCQGLIDAVVGSEDNPSTNVPTVVHITGIEITAEGVVDGTLEMVTGTTLQLATKITPEDTKELDITWKSIDESVLKISSTGLLEAVGVGVAKVVVASAIDPSVSAVLTVTVVGSAEALGINDEAVDQSKADTRG